MSETSPAGILPCQTLEALIAQAAITAARPFDADQVQPASLDLRLGLRAWRVRASFLPRPGRTVADRLADVVMHEIARSIERSERQNYGMGIILTLVLSALLSEIVKAVLRWWLQSASNRALMLGWQTEMRR